MRNIRQNRWFDRALERSPDYVSFGLVIICGFLLARLTWALFPAEPHLPGADPSQTVEQNSSVMQDLGEKIASYHLFGKHEPGNAVAPKPTAIQNTQLALKLQGVYSLPGKRGQAVIEEGGQQHVYFVGETIGNSGAVLEEVFATYVALRRNGNLEKLELPKPETSSGGAGPTAGGGFMDAPQADYQPELPVMDNPAYMSAPDIVVEDPIPPDAQTVSEAASMEVNPLTGEAPPAEGATNLAEFRKEVLNNNMRLLEVASPQPYEVDGKFIGFKLQPGSNVAVFNQLGLQPGDIVTTVNGSVLDSPAAGVQALQGAASASQVTLGITRGGQQITLPLSF